MAKQKKKSKKTTDELSAVEAVHGALEPLSPSERSRVVASVQALMQIPGAGLLERAADKIEPETSGGRRARSQKKSTNGRKKSSRGRRKTTAKSSRGRKSTRKATGRKKSGRKKSSAS